ncbi:MAG: adenine deaminase, partial [Alphaproteobacteria bacterium]|nr:adenine deaminase [Alphaproteobacteria bacterium]
IFHKDEKVLDKLEAFKGCHIDGHCPLVSGKELNAYCAVGIKNCHESTTYDEAKEKLRKGMQVLMRGGSVSKDVTALAPLLDEINSPFMAFCTDDRNPLDIADEGHIDHLIKLAIKAGASPIMAYRAASWSAAQGFGLKDRGLIAPSYLADIVLLENLEQCTVKTVIKSGKVVTPDIFTQQTGKNNIGYNTVKRSPVTKADFRIQSKKTSTTVIGIIPNSIITEKLQLDLPVKNGEKHQDPSQDTAKVCVLARHGSNDNIGRGFVKGFGLQGNCALGSTVGHDSHNICTVGTNDDDMTVAVNRLIELGGGFVAVKDGKVIAEIALPIGGLMSDKPYKEVEETLRKLRSTTKDMGIALDEPFLQLAFLPLPVIPHLKITDFGLFDVDNFKVIDE